MTGSTHDVVVAGAGVVGATLACALAGSGLRVALAGAEPAARGPGPRRVLALTRASEQVFTHLNAWDGMQGRGASVFREMDVWDAGSTGRVHFDSTEVGEPHLGHIVESGVVVSALLERIAQAADVECLPEARVETFERDANVVTVRLEGGESLRARLLVGADGAASHVRAAAGIEQASLKYDQRAIVAEVRTAMPHRETAWQRFLPSGPLAFLPLADGRCSIVWSCDEERAAELLAFGDDDFRRELAGAFEFRLGEVTECGPRVSFPLVAAHVRSYAQPRLVLAGDAAHTIHPLAGQGANLGIADAATLAQVVLEAVQVRLDPGEMAVLRRYERWRKGENLLMLGTMDGFKRAFGSQWAPIRHARGLGLRLVDAAGPLKRTLMRRAMGLAGDLPALARP